MTYDDKNELIKTYREQIAVNQKYRGLKNINQYNGVEGYVALYWEGIMIGMCLMNQIDDNCLAIVICIDFNLEYDQTLLFFVFEYKIL